MSDLFHARVPLAFIRDVFDVCRERNWMLRELTRNRHSLEDIYVHVTRPEEEEEA